MFEVHALAVQGLQMAELSEQSTQVLMQLEEDLWRSEVRYSPEKMDKLLDDEFIEIGSSGRIYDKRETLATPVQDIGARLPLVDFSTRGLAPSLVLVRYRSIQRNPDGSEKQALRSSIWKQTNQGWKLCFHQGTPVPPA
jgi:hypothetical protein